MFGGETVSASLDRTLVSSTASEPVSKVKLNQLIDLRYTGKSKNTKKGSLSCFAFSKQLPFDILGCVEYIPPDSPQYWHGRLNSQQSSTTGSKGKKNICFNPTAKKSRHTGALSKARVDSNFTTKTGGHDKEN